MKISMISVSFFLALRCFATDYMVSSADEANKMLNSAKPNDKVILKDGIYQNAIIKFTNSNIYFVAEHLGKVFFEGNSTLSFAGEKNMVEGFVWQNGGKELDAKSVIEFKNNKENANHSTLKNCVIDAYNTADLNTDNKWLSVYGQYNMVTQCLFKSKFNKGATLVVWLDGKTEAHHTISYNYFLNRQNGPDADNGLESMRIGTSETSFTPSNCVVAFNRFEKCDGEIEIISNKSWNNSYLHNTFVNNDGGLTLRHGNNCLVDGNFFDGADKVKSYGVRFIGEGHVAINNYFYHLNGATNNPFRAPVTIVNGLVNTPLNGYYQVRRAVVADNIFVNCLTPNIRVGAFSKREGMTVAPDTITIKNNLLYNDDGKAADAYEELTTPTHLLISNNKIIGQSFKFQKAGFEMLKSKGSKRDGFDLIKDGNGNMVASVKAKAALVDNIGVGANWVDPSIMSEVKKRKYTILSAKEVGPSWMR